MIKSTIGSRYQLDNADENDLIGALITHLS